MNVAARIRRFMLPRSLRFQLLSRSLLIIAALLALIGLFQFVVMQDFIYKNKAQSMQDQVLRIPRDVWQQFGQGIDGGSGMRRSPMFFSPDTSLALVDEEGDLSVISSGRDSDAPPPKLSTEQYQKAMQQGRGLNYQVVKDSGGGEQLVVLQPVAGHGHVLGLIQANVSTKPLKEVLLKQLLTFLSLSIVALVVGVLAFLPVLRRTLIPLSTMVDTVRQIDSGNLDERFPANQGQEEIDRLAVSFNGMLERLEASFEAEREAREQMRRFVADASHELRTPLTSIHGFLEVLLRGAMNHPEQLRKALTSMYGESERINKLVQDLLLLAKLDRAPVMELKEGDLNDVIRDMEPQLRLLAGKRQVTLLLGSAPRCFYDMDKMKQVILNLFHNAVQHTDPEKGHIQLSTTSAPGDVELTFRDNGTGIGKEHLPHVFDRFYRSDSSRTRKYGGAGLGLSITKSIIEAHGGSIRIESSEGQGSAFIVRLPEESNGTNIQ